MSAVGRIALGVVGALIAPVGFAALGFAIGSSIGGMIFAPSGPKVEGPRLGDTTVTASSLGKVIPEHYGITRSAGNVIWSAGLKEVKKVEKQRGKGGGGGSTTTYSYYCSFAIAFGGGRAQSVRRMWADGKLIYDVTNPKQVSDPKYKFRFYNGNDSQNIDPLYNESINRRLAGLPDVNRGNQEQAKYQTINDLISQFSAASGQRAGMYANLLQARKTSAEAGLRSGAVPNYNFVSGLRGLVYMLFDDMPLEDFGNRIPNITAEIIWEGAGRNWQLGDTDEDSRMAPGYVVPERGAGEPVPDGLMGWSFGTQKLITSNSSVVRRFALSTLNEDGRKDNLLAVGGGVWAILLGGFLRQIKVHCADDSGWAYGTGSVQLLNSNIRTVAFRISETSLSVSDVHDITSVPNSAAYIPGAHVNNIFMLTSAMDLSSVSDRSGLLLEVHGNSVRLGSEWVGGGYRSVALPTSFNGTAVGSAGPVVYSGRNDRGFATAVAVRYGNRVISLSRLKMARAVTGGHHDAQETTYIHEVDHTGGVSSGIGANITRICGVIADTTGHRVYVLAGLANGHTLFVGFNAELQVEYQHELPFAAPSANCGLTTYRTSPGTITFGAGDKVISLALATGEHTVYETSGGHNINPAAQMYVENINALLAWSNGVPHLFYAAGGAGGPLVDLAGALPDVVAAICRRAGMQDSEFDVSALPRRPVRGYSITRTSAARANLEPLMRAYFMEGVESDNKIKFRIRQNTPVVRIHENELGKLSVNTGSANWAEARTPEYDLPAEINFNFADALRDHQTNTVHQRRIGAPVSSMHSVSVDNIEMPVVFTVDEANTITERLLYETWLRRDTAKARLNWRYTDLDAGDLIEVEFADGRIVTDRIVKMTLGANFELEIDTERAGDPVDVPAPSTVVPVGSIPTTTISLPIPSRMFAMDMPLLFDYHAGAGTALSYYTALGSDSEQWRSGSVYLSWDDALYQGVTSLNLDITWGQISEPLGPPRALWSTDVDNTIEVSVPFDRGDIASITRADILNGENKAIIWNPQTGEVEVIQFMDVTISEDGLRYTLSNLQRGLRGTEAAAFNHTDGEYFFLVDERNLQMGAFEPSRLGSTSYFKGVSAGQVVSAAPTLQVPVRGRALMPWAPSRVRRQTDGGNVVVTWNRRARLNGAWNMNSPIQSVPLEESGEFYEFYVIRGSVSAFNPDNPATYHLKTVVTSPTYTITAAELAAAGLSTASEIGVAVYQVSTVVGRGFPAVGSLAP